MLLQIPCGRAMVSTGIEGYDIVLRPSHGGYKRVATVMLPLFSNPCAWVLAKRVSTGYWRVSLCRKRGSFLFLRIVCASSLPTPPSPSNTASRFHSAFPHSPPSVSGTRLLRRHSFFIILIIRNNKREEKNYGSRTILGCIINLMLVRLCRFRFEFGSGPSLLRCWIGQCLQRKGWRDLPLIGLTNSYVRIDGDFCCCRFVEEEEEVKLV